MAKKGKGVTITLSKGLLAAIVIIVILVGIVGYLLMGGGFTLPGATTLKSSEEAADAVIDVGSDVQEITSILSDLDDSLS